jgi:hypothetical protein
MNEETWQANNSRYLSAALEWLRLRLMRLAAVDADRTMTVEPMTVEVASSSIVDRLFGRPTSTAPLHAPALPAPSDSMDEQIDRAAQIMRELEDTDPPPAMIMLSRQLGLSRFESEALLLCAAMELDTRIATLCARAHADAQRPYPTFALALALFDDPAWEALSPDRPLRYWRMIEINQPAAQPLTTSALRADERIVNYLKGLNHLDDRLTVMLSPIDSADTHEDLPPSQQAVVDDIVAHWQRSLNSARLPIVQLLGPDASAKQIVAAQATSALGRHLYRLQVESLPSSLGDLETLARLWQRESSLLPIALYLDAQDIDSGQLDGHASLTQFLSRSDGVIFLGVRDSWPRLTHTHFSVEVAKPTTTEQQAIWMQALGPQAAHVAGQLAAQFNLNQAAIESIAQDVSLDAAEDEPHFKRKLWAACCAMTRPRLDVLAQRIGPRATWDDLVLPSEQITLLHQIADQVGQRHTVYEEWGYAARMNRGLGISALFAGDSGTGKTMAAEVMANDLQLNLYRIDLSAVVSKYIGETEKNLRRLFDAAEDGGAILFFDEADALFGKRSEVKDSHDRYANIEINYLLQRMEAYRGLAILATNMKSALDQAFMRRLRFIVNFPFPGVSERASMWRKVFPAQTPVDGLDYDRLARFNITGGNIHSIALNAAFMAAQAKSKVTMPIVLAAARTEFRKLEKPINEAEFRV